MFGDVLDRFSDPFSCVSRHVSYRAQTSGAILFCNSLTVRSRQGAGKKGRKNSGQNLRPFPLKFGTGFVPQNQKSTASFHPIFSSVLSRSGIVF